MKSNFELVKDFHSTFSQIPDPDQPTVPEPDEIRLRVRLMVEELQETLAELGMVADIEIRSIDYAPKIDLAKLAKELADLIYVVYGTGAKAGLPMDAVFAEVHASNMSKAGPNGEVSYRSDGKVIKGPNYYEPDIRALLRQNSAI